MFANENPIGNIPKKQNVDWEYIIQHGLSLSIFSYFIFIGGQGDKIANYIEVNGVTIILFTCLFVAWLSYCLISGKRIVRPKYMVIIQGFLVIVFIPVLLSINFWQSLNEYYLWGFYFFILYGIVNIIYLGWKAIYLLNSFLFVGGLFNFFKIFQASIWFYEWANNSGQGLTAVSIYRTISPNQTAAFANLILMLALAVIVERRKKAKILFQIYLIVSSIIVVLLSASRGGIVAMLAGISIIIVAKATPGNKLLGDIWSKHKWIVVILGLLGLLLFSGSVLIISNSGRSGIGARFDFWEVALRSFSQNPFFGSGLYTMGNHLYFIRSVPPQILHTHAHNIFLNILGELGFFCFAFFVVMLIVIVRNIYQNFRKENNHIALGAIGSLGSFLTHGFVDTLYVEPILAISIVIVCGVALARVEKPVHVKIPVLKSESVWYIGLVICLGWILLYQRAPLDKAVSNINNKEEAIKQLGVAINRKPGWTLAYQQRAIAASFLATEKGEKEQDQINLAIQDFEEAINQDPAWAVNYANLGVLYAARGDYNQALKLLEQAIKIAPDSALFHLNMAGTAELSGEKDLAEIHYWNYLLLQDNWDLGPFWRDTPVRQSIYYKVRKVRLIDIEPAKSVEDLISSLEPGAYNSEIYLHMSERYYDLGEYRLAQDALRIAELGISESNRLYPDLLWNKARINVAEGNYDKGLDYAQSALNRWRFQSSEGPGTYGNSKYGERLFRSPTINDDLVPQFTIAPFPASWIDRLVTTGKWYLEINKTKDAEEIFLEVLEYDSDHSEASSLLSELK